MSTMLADIYEHVHMLMILPNEAMIESLFSDLWLFIWWDRLRDETKFKNNIVDCFLTLKSVISDTWQVTFLITQQIEKLNTNFIDKNVGTDYIPVYYHPLKRNNNMSVIIKDLNVSLNGKDKSSETIKVVKHRISEGTNLPQNIDFKISSKQSDKALSMNHTSTKFLTMLLIIW